MATKLPILPIHDMEQRHPGLTKPIADSYSEAARVCLDRHHHSPTEFVLDRSGSCSPVTVEWESTDERVRRAWRNEIDATEAGAYACALAAVELADGRVAVRRAETMTGADYYIAQPGYSADDLEDCVRLEVSGVSQGPKRDVDRRLRRKLDQAAAGRSNLPAVVGIVGFRVRVLRLADLKSSPRLTTGS